ncbi:PulJ/GspJ family protein, partial [Vibrio parahaemolyticus]
MATLNRQSAGFTLVEVLIAIVIMSSVVVLAGQSYRQFVVTANDFD